MIVLVYNRGVEAQVEGGLRVEESEVVVEREEQVKMIAEVVRWRWTEVDGF